MASNFAPPKTETGNADAASIEATDGTETTSLMENKDEEESLAQTILTTDRPVQIHQK